MTTFQLLVQRGFEEGTEFGIDRQKTITIKNMIAHDIAPDRIASILQICESEVDKLIAENQK